MSSVDAAQHVGAAGAVRVGLLDVAQRDERVRARARHRPGGCRPAARAGWIVRKTPWALDLVFCFSGTDGELDGTTSGTVSLIIQTSSSFPPRPWTDQGPSAAPAQAPASAGPERRSCIGGGMEAPYTTPEPDACRRVRFCHLFQAKELRLAVQSRTRGRCSMANNCRPRGERREARARRTQAEDPSKEARCTFDSLTVTSTPTRGNSRVGPRRFISRPRPSSC